MVSAAGSVRIGSRGASGRVSGGNSGGDSKGSRPKGAAHARDCAPIGGLAVLCKHSVAACSEPLADLTLPRQIFRPRGSKYARGMDAAKPALQSKPENAGARKWDRFVPPSQSAEAGRP